MGAETKTRYTTDGRTGWLSRATGHALEALEIALGYDRHTLTITQFGWMGSSSFSGNTHGGDAADGSYADHDRKSRYGRLLGLWVAPRTVADGGGSWSIAHVHIGRIGASSASAAMKGQIAEYLDGGDGLRGAVPDRQWRPRYPNIRFVDDLVHERWIATKDTNGYTQPGALAKDADLIKVRRRKGFVWAGDNLATVRVNGTEWLVSTSMTFYRKADFNVYVPGFVAKTERWTVAKGPALGRVAAGPKAARKAGIPARPVGFGIVSAGYRIVAGVKFVMTSHGTWYTAASLKAKVPAKPTKPAPVASSINATLVTQNVIRWRLNAKNVRGVANFKTGADYAVRCPLMAGMVKGRGVSLATTAEAGQYADGDRYAKALGSTFANVLHGDAAGDITQSVAHDGKVYKLRREGSITTTGADHNTVTVSELEDLDTGIAFVVAAVHLAWRSGLAWDKAREVQVATAIPLVEKWAHGLPIIWAGDFNSTLDNTYDGPGKAMAAAGYLDAELSTCAVVNPGADSYNGLKNPPVTRARQMDRCFAKPALVTFRLREVVVHLDAAGNHVLPWPSDHQPVLFEFTIRRK